MKKEKRRKKKEKDIRQEWKVNVGKKMVKEKYKKETKKADLRILIRSDKTYFPYPTLGLYRNCQKMRKYKHCVEVYAQSTVIKNLLMSLKIKK